MFLRSSQGARYRIEEKERQENTELVDSKGFRDDDDIVTRVLSFIVSNNLAFFQGSETLYRCCVESWICSFENNSDVDPFRQVTCSNWSCLKM